MFKGKKILVIIPHQDDEINIAGGFIAKNSKENEIYILYTTNGDYIYSAEHRISESLKSCRTLGVDEKHVLFLGYSDQYSSNNNHIYMSDELWVSRNGRTETYLPLDKKEVAEQYGNRHSIFNRGNFISDMRLAIEKILPDIIVCVDFDSHCDHRAASLAFERALGEIISENKYYTPLVYKGFAYPTAYFGNDDFGQINIRSTKFNTEKYSFCALENPYYTSKDSVRFLLSSDCVEKRLWKNRIFKALKCHKSQIISRRAKSIINGDQLFFQRRTSSLLRKADIAVSSGDKTKLDDFMLFDCPDVMKGDSEMPKLNNNAWAPNESHPRINIALEQKTKIKIIKIYNAVSSKNINDFSLLLDGEEYGHYHFENQLVNEIELNDDPECKRVCLIFDNKALGLALSELEIFEASDNEIMGIDAFIDGDMAYKYYIDKSFNLEIYAYDGDRQKKIEPQLLNFYINGKKEEYDKIVFEKLERKNNICAELKENKNIQTNFILLKKNKIDVIMNLLLNSVNYAYIMAVALLQKVYRKLFIKKSV